MDRNNHTIELRGAPWSTDKKKARNIIVLALTRRGVATVETYALFQFVARSFHFETGGSVSWCWSAALSATVRPP